jgi:hypothetical protein
MVPAGDQADAFLVPARPTASWRCSSSSAPPGRGTTRGYGTQDGGRAAEVTWPTPPPHWSPPTAWPRWNMRVDIGIAATCAEAVGVMDKTMAITVEYMNTRKQFGVPIASFQALRHRVADMKMQLELARSMSYYASLKLNAPRRAPPRAGPRQVPAGQSMRFVGQQAVQLHGGIGVTDEYIVQPLLQEAHPAGNDLRGHPAPPGRGVGQNAGHGRRVCLTPAPDCYIYSGSRNTGAGRSRF